MYRQQYSWVRKHDKTMPLQTARDIRSMRCELHTANTTYKTLNNDLNSNDSDCSHISRFPLHPIIHIRIHIARRVLKARVRRPRRAIPNKFIGKPRPWGLGPRTRTPSQVDAPATAPRSSTRRPKAPVGGSARRASRITPICRRLQVTAPASRTPHRAS